MSNVTNTSEFIPVSKIFLDLENPRHKPYTKQAQAISYLCKKEQIGAIARDIVDLGLNPTQNFALLSEGKGDDETYIVLEGNRRMCALKLLHDPELVQKSKRSVFEKLSADWKAQINLVEAVVFTDRAEAKIWLERIHGGAQGGVGQRWWNSTQKERFNDNSKHRLALAVLEYGIQKGFITEEDSKKKLTTVSRYVMNRVAKEVFGLDSNNPDAIGRTRPTADFDMLQAQFLKDLVIKDIKTGQPIVNSRQNALAIEAYARQLPKQVGVGIDRIDTEPMDAQDSGTTKQPTSTPRGAPRAPKHTPPPASKVIVYDQGFAGDLQKLDNQKMISLYYSVCTVGLKHHTPLVTVGVWSLVESLMTFVGKGDATFKAFFSNQAQNSQDFSNDQKKHINEAFYRITANGNTTKHGSIGANFNGDDLVNDMAIVTPALRWLVHQSTKKNKV